MNHPSYSDSTRVCVHVNIVALFQKKYIRSDCVTTHKEKKNHQQKSISNYNPISNRLKILMNIKPAAVILHEQFNNNADYESFTLCIIPTF